MKKTIPLLFVFILLWAARPMQAQQTIQIGEKGELVSEVMQETRKYWVGLPHNYQHSQADRYPLIVLLDGHSNFDHTWGTARYLAYRHKMPEAIIVAVLNTDRNRDLTPPTLQHKEQFPTAGGAERFYDFLTEELVPHIDKTYRTLPYRCLVGHSFGGLFAMHNFVHQEPFFQTYLAISPSMWWENTRLVAQADSAFQSQRPPKARIYLSMANEGGSMLRGTKQLIKKFEAYGAGQIESEFLHLKEENHGTIPHPTTYHGLPFLFEGWVLQNPAEAYAEGGINALEKHYEQVSSAKGVTIPLPENELNELGYEFLRRTQLADAIQVFQAATAQYPASPNAWDSLGEAYEEQKDLRQALVSYQKAVTLAEQQSHANLTYFQQNHHRIQQQLEKN